jgi:hypothetical protein
MDSYNRNTRATNHQVPTHAFHHANLATNHPYANHLAKILLFYLL